MAEKVEAKGKGFCGVKGLTEDALTAAAEDLNTSLGLDPAIDVEDLEGEELLEAVKISFEEVYANDQLEDETWKVMELLGIEAQPAPEEEDAPAAKGKAKKAEPEDDDDDDAPAPKKAAPAKGKKAAPVEDDDDDDAPAPKKGGKVKKAEPEDDDDTPAPAKAKKAAPAPAKKKDEGPKYSRSDAFGEALMSGKKNKKSLAQIVEDSDKLYSEATGRRSNTKEATWCANLSLKALAACGYVTVDGDAVEILVRP